MTYFGSRKYPCLYSPSRLLCYFFVCLFLFLLFPGNFSRQEKKRFLHKYTENFKSECLVTGYISLLSLERNLVLSELTFQLFEYDFKTMSSRSQKTPHRLCLFSRVLPRFIGSKTYVPIVINLRWENVKLLKH